MHPLMLGIEILTLVPNHLSNVKNYQSKTSISYPYSSLFTTFHPSNIKTTTLHQSGEGKRGVEVKKRVARRRKRSGNEDAEEKRGVEKVREVHIDTNP